MTVLVAHPDFTLVKGAMSQTMLFLPVTGQGQIVRMNQRAPDLCRHGAELLRAVAYQLGPAGIENDLTGLQVPFPGAGMGAIQNVLQAFTLVRQIGCHGAGHRFGAGAAPGQQPD